MPLEPGSRLGPYEIVDALGAGGMGEVYRARDTRLDRTVAIKVLPVHLSDQPQARQRFEREARAVSDLNHPHICTLYDVGHEGGVDYLVMEYLEGRTLADRLEEGPLPPDEGLRYAIQIAEALDVAHRKGVIHRDLKPGNVMLTRTGAKLLDFGLAKSAALAGAGGAGNLTRTPTMTSPLTAEGSIVGTFQYMAPEQLEGKDADARSDIFAFGALLYEMLTGQRAFAGDSQASLIASIIKEDPRPLSAAAPLAPRSLDRVVRRCLAKQPGERWQTARDLALELKWVGEQGGAEAEEERAAATRPGAAWFPWLVAVAALAVAAVFALRGGSPTSGPRPVVRLTIPVPGATEFGDDLASPPALSPDGRTVVFGVIDDSGARSLLLRSIDDFNGRPLANTGDASLAFWSPDNRNVGFFAAGKIKRVEVATGRVQTVTDAAYPRGASWSRGGKIVFAPNSNTGIHVVDATGGEARMVTEPDPDVADSSHRWPFFLPDGRHFLFVFWTNDPRARQEHGGVYVASLDGDEPPRLVLPDASSVAYVPPGYLLVVRGENLIAVPFDAGARQVRGEAVIVAEKVLYNPGNGHSMFSASDEGTLVYGAGSTGLLMSELVWYDRRGTPTTPVGDPAAYANIRLAPDERRAAAAIFGESSATGEIWTVDLSRGVRTRLAFGAWYHDYPVWSPGGDRVLYASQHSGALEFYTRPADGSGEQELFFGTERDKELYDWSRDGKYLAYWEVGSGSTTPDISIYSVELQKAEPLLAGEAAYTNAQFSPDSRWLAYASDESGRQEVFVQAFGGVGDGGVRRGGRWQVSTAGGRMPHWRDDGRELIYLDLERRVMAVPVEAREGGLLLGTPQELFRIPKPIAAADAAGDHQRFLVAVREEAGGEPLHVVIGWPAEL